MTAWSKHIDEISFKRVAWVEDPRVDTIDWEQVILLPIETNSPSETGTNCLATIHDVVIDAISGQGGPQDMLTVLGQRLIVQVDGSEQGHEKTETHKKAPELFHSRHMFQFHNEIAVKLFRVIQEEIVIEGVLDMGEGEEFYFRPDTRTILTKSEKTEAQIEDIKKMLEDYFIANEASPGDMAEKLVKVSAYTIGVEDDGSYKATGTMDGEEYEIFGQMGQYLKENFLLFTNVLVVTHKQENSGEEDVYIRKEFEGQIHILTTADNPNAEIMKALLCETKEGCSDMLSNIQNLPVKDTSYTAIKAVTHLHQTEYKFREFPKLFRQVYSPENNQKEGEIEVRIKRSAGDTYILWNNQIYSTKSDRNNGWGRVAINIDKDSFPEGIERITLKGKSEDGYFFRCKDVEVTYSMKWVVRTEGGSKVLRRMYVDSRIAQGVEALLTEDYWYLKEENGSYVKIKNDWVDEEDDMLTLIDSISYEPQDSHDVIKGYQKNKDTSMCVLLQNNGRTNIIAVEIITPETLRNKLNTVLIPLDSLGEENIRDEEKREYRELFLLYQQNRDKITTGDKVIVEINEGGRKRYLLADPDMSTGDMVEKQGDLDERAELVVTKKGIGNGQVIRDMGEHKTFYWRQSQLLMDLDGRIIELCMDLKTAEKIPLINHQEIIRLSTQELEDFQKVEEDMADVFKGMWLVNEMARNIYLMAILYCSIVFLYEYIFRKEANGESNDVNLAIGVIFGVIFGIWVAKVAPFIESIENHKRRKLEDLQQIMKVNLGRPLSLKEAKKINAHLRKEDGFSDELLDKLFKDHVTISDKEFAQLSENEKNVIRIEINKQLMKRINKVLEGDQKSCVENLFPCLDHGSKELKKALERAIVLLNSDRIDVEGPEQSGSGAQPVSIKPQKIPRNRVAPTVIQVQDTTF